MDDIPASEVPVYEELSDPTEPTSCSPLCMT